MVVMLNRAVEQETREWWKDRSDRTPSAGFRAALAAHQRDVFAAGWRRNLMIAVLTVSSLYLLGLIAG